MKISIIGAGNVGSTAALRLLEAQTGDIVLVDIAKGQAFGKAMDLDDARRILKQDYRIEGTDDFSRINDSDIVVVTAGFPRKPGMTREELLNKNAQIVKEVALKIKEHSFGAIVIIVTNPLDLMTYLAKEVTGIMPGKVLGMGISLDASRFANLISQELGVACSDIEAQVIGSHGEGMLPLVRFCKVKGAPLSKLLDDERIALLAKRTVERGKEIVAALGSGSAYFAPSAAIADLVKAIAKDEKRTIGVCTYLNGQYGIKDVCIGLPCVIGKGGIEKIIELELDTQEKESLLKSAGALRALIDQLEVK
ncbi:MAG: malate dehydrogenase [Candidatus Omnitrophica bacterium]|nr:malate dehydrogenase [Candidatus Omnitrophota bacterium]